MIVIDFIKMLYNFILLCREEFFNETAFSEKSCGVITGTILYYDDAVSQSVFSGVLAAETRDPVNQQNIIYINADDLGYGDIGCYGSILNKTPNIDQMAEEGVRFTDFYACPLCTPSRMSLMTGCYALRAGLPSVIGANASIGISENEITIADNLKSKGYTTAIVGKWHLGHHKQFLPTNHGFDSFFGIPYSNDFLSSPLPLMQNEDVLEWDPDQTKITERYVDECKDIIKRNRNKPFFLYFAHMDVHKPLRVSDEALVNSDNGRYGAKVEAVDWSVGEILKTVKALGLEKNTMVIFTSDNGGFLSLSPSEGDTGTVSNAPLSGGKGQATEGGVRVPFVVRWPGQVPEGKINSEIATVMDMFPTFSALAGASLPTDRVIDGKNILPLIRCEEGAKTPHNAIYYYVDKDLRAVRSGKWKLNVYTKSLYDLEADIGEKTNLYNSFPDVIKELTKYVDIATADIGNKTIVGKNARAPGDTGKTTSVYGNVNGLTVEEIDYGEISVMDLIDAIPSPLDKNNTEHVRTVEKAGKAFDLLSDEGMAANYESLLAAEVILSVNTSGLESKINLARDIIRQQEETENGKYLPSSYNTFLQVYDRAAALVETSADQNEIDQMTTELSTAIDQLKEAPDKSQLRALVDSAKKIDTGRYTEKSVAAFRDSLSAAETVLKDLDAEDEIVKDARNKLESAVKNLEDKDGPSSKKDSSDYTSSKSSSSGLSSGDPLSSNISSKTADSGIKTDTQSTESNSNSGAFPKTGDLFHGFTALLMAVISAVAIIVIRITRKKRIQ